MYTPPRPRTDGTTPTAESERDPRRSSLYMHVCAFCSVRSSSNASKQQLGGVEDVKASRVLAQPATVASPSDLGVGPPHRSRVSSSQQQHAAPATSTLFITGYGATHVSHRMSPPTTRDPHQSGNLNAAAHRHSASYAVAGPRSYTIEGRQSSSRKMKRRFRASRSGDEISTSSSHSSSIAASPLAFASAERRSSVSARSASCW